LYYLHIKFGYIAYFEKNFNLKKGLHHGYRKRQQSLLMHISQLIAENCIILYHLQ